MRKTVNVPGYSGGLESIARKISKDNLLAAVLQNIAFELREQTETYANSEQTPQREDPVLVEILNHVVNDYQQGGNAFGDEYAFLNIDHAESSDHLKDLARNISNLEYERFSAFSEMLASSLRMANMPNMRTRLGDVIDISSMPELSKQQRNSLIAASHLTSAAGYLALADLHYQKHHA
ncbi:hypothetical protein H6503_03415 [Candidatus Woesearchaeota archaeon]|nr:hypothetical protein [Candidatus Woesearchaeota archaeon]